MLNSSVFRPHQHPPPHQEAAFSDGAEAGAGENDYFGRSNKVAITSRSSCLSRTTPLTLVTIQTLTMTSKVQTMKLQSQNTWYAMNQMIYSPK